MSDTAAPDRAGLRTWLIVAAAAAAVVGLVAALGGFERREVPWLEAGPGDEIDARNLVFRFDSATVQHLTEATDSPWRVVVSGSVRNPHDETLTPLTGNYGNLSGIQRGAEPEVSVDWQVGLGPTSPDSGYNRRQVVPPDDQWMTMTATFRFDALEPDETFQIGVSPMEYSATSVLGVAPDPEWNTDSYALPTMVTVPLTQLPDTDY